MNTLKIMSLVATFFVSSNTLFAQVNPSEEKRNEPAVEFVTPILTHVKVTADGKFIDIVKMEQLTPEQYQWLRNKLDQQPDTQPYFSWQNGVGYLVSSVVNAAQSTVILTFLTTKALLKNGYNLTKWIAQNGWAITQDLLHEDWLDPLDDLIPDEFQNKPRPLDLV